MLVGLGIWIQQGGLDIPNPVPPAYWVGLIIMCTGGGIGIWGWFRSSTKAEAETASLLEDIKTDLVTMNAYQRERAIQEAQASCDGETAMQIQSDFLALFGDAPSFATGLVNEVLVNRNVDALIDFFRKVGNILDSNNYGLKTKLENEDVYNRAYVDVSQKLLRLPVKKKRRTIIQKNIERVHSLAYGLNSSILLREALKTVPEAYRLVPTEIRIVLESIETQKDSTLNTLLADLENDWTLKVRRK